MASARTKPFDMKPGATQTNPATGLTWTFSFDGGSMEWRGECRHNGYIAIAVCFCRSETTHWGVSRIENKAAIKSGSVFDRDDQFAVAVKEAEGALLSLCTVEDERRP